MVESKTNLRREVINNAIGKSRANSKFAATEDLLRQIHDPEVPFPNIESYVITYKNETVAEMGSYKIIDGLLYDGADLVEINGKPIIIQRIVEFFD
jgi:hypothetical protein